MIGQNAHVAREVIEESAQVATTSWVDVGSLIEMWGYTRVGVWLDLYVLNSGSISFRSLAKLDRGDTSEYPLQIKSVGATEVDYKGGQINLYEQDGDRYLFVVETDGVIPYIQLQMKTSVTPDTSYVDRIEVTKVYT